ncbi:MAG: hypothetical protein KF729_29820 [Sandaracinaceae bacterium]|nr:hypothetical protein [Sandaracinaceae bacterium]
MKPAPIGEGLALRRVRLAREDVYVLGGILAGEDHLASIHGEGACADGRVVVAIVTASARAAELDAWLDELAGPLGLERDP